MKEWDGILVIIAGGGIGLYAGVHAWRYWRDRQPSAAIGSILLGFASLLLPLILALIRE